jgi:hypothetical protein
VVGRKVLGRVGGHNIRIDHNIVKEVDVGLGAGGWEGAAILDDVSESCS